MSHIYSFDFPHGNFLSVWHSSNTSVASEDPSAPQIFSNSESHINVHADEASTPPAKRPRYSTPKSEPESSSAEIVTENGAVRKTRRKKKSGVPAANISQMIGTSDGRYVIAITDEDKCVRLLKLKERGALEQLTARQASILGFCKSCGLKER